MTIKTKAIFISDLVPHVKVTQVDFERTKNSQRPTGERLFHMSSPWKHRFSMKMCNQDALEQHGVFKIVQNLEYSYRVLQSEMVINHFRLALLQKC